ncbi:MAG TPA: hypothetical protein VHK01_17705 [Lacipirellulaceae bacterium]|jgi:hypothetical protein|nr:hypothetical protein [Lacipirellulaceae bacterium]
MPLVQGGPPEWIWERPSEQLSWELLPTRPAEEHADFELRVRCGLEMVRLQFFTKEEIAELQSVLADIRTEQLSL